MNRKITSLALTAVFALSPLVSLAQEATPAALTFDDVRVIGVQTLPNDLTVDDTTVGGLSGIDYDAANDRWVAISDDRSDLQPARFYNLNLDYTSQEFTSVEITSAVTLKQANGEVYPNSTAGGNVPDPESIRIDPITGDLWYTSEGSQKLLIDPFVAATTWDGDFIASPALPAIFEMSADQLTGPRDNLVFEGLTFSADGTSLWVGMEGPLYQDGPTATPEHGAPVRITNIDRSGNVLAQYVFEADAIPGPTPGFNTTGVTEVLAIDETRFFAIERATVVDDAGIYQNYIKVWEIDTAGATDVKSQDWLTEGGYTPVSKKLVLDLNTEGLDWVDNIEGITWGPTLEDGHRSLVLVSDNNFNDTQITQIIALDVES